LIYTIFGSIPILKQKSVLIQTKQTANLVKKRSGFVVSGLDV